MKRTKKYKKYEEINNEYLSTTLERILEPLTVELLQELPEDPETFTINFLKDHFGNRKGFNEGERTELEILRNEVPRLRALIENQAAGGDASGEEEAQPAKEEGDEEAEAEGEGEADAEEGEGEEEDEDDEDEEQEKRSDIPTSEEDSDEEGDDVLEVLPSALPVRKGPRKSVSSEAFGMNNKKENFKHVVVEKTEEERD